MREGRQAVAATTALYIGTVFWITASSNFANPAMTLAWDLSGATMNSALDSAAFLMA